MERFRRGVMTQLGGSSLNHYYRAVISSRESSLWVAELDGTVVAVRPPRRPREIVTARALRRRVPVRRASEFAWGLVLFAWLFGVAVGARIGGWTAPRLRRSQSLFGPETTASQRALGELHPIQIRSVLRRQLQAVLGARAQQLGLPVLAIVMHRPPLLGRAGMCVAF